MRLHLGGTEPREGWHLFNAQQLDGVDTVGNVTELPFEDESFATVYASHLIEHLGYQEELPKALAGIHRVLKPGGKLMVSVPDLDTLAALFVSPTLDVNERFHVMRIMFGGQTDEWDFHKVGFTLPIMSHFLAQAGFSEIRQTDGFGLFNDCSDVTVCGVPISLNVEARK